MGHLLDHARLTRRDKVLVRARAGDESEEAITNAMVEPAAELEGEHGFPMGASEPNTAGAGAAEWGCRATSRTSWRSAASLGGRVEETTTPAEMDELGEDSLEEDKLNEKPVPCTVRPSRGWLKRRN